jgi:hypothetical protein
MADIVSELAAKCGISTEMVQKGLGAVLAYVKSFLPGEAYAKLTSAVPGAEKLAADAEAAPAPSGGVLSALTGAMNKLFGGGGEGQLLSRLTGAGFSAEQVQSFLPGVLEKLKGKLPDDVMKQITDKLPVPEGAAH